MTKRTAALRCAWCGCIITPDAGAGPQGSDGICPDCALEFYARNKLLPRLAVRLLTAIDAANKVDFWEVIAEIRELVEREENNVSG